jgi:hypothetical protein
MICTSAPFHTFSPVLALAYAVLSPLHVFNLICSLPLLEDLAIRGFAIGGDDDRDQHLQLPQTSPPLTGTLAMYEFQGMENAIRRLLELPNGVRFRGFECEWNLNEDLRWMSTLVGACSDTLEYVEIEHNSTSLLLLR